MQTWNTPDHHIAGAEHGTLTFSGGEELVLADWEVTEAAPDQDGRVYASVRGWIANTEGTGRGDDPYVLPIKAGRAQLVLAELRGREPLRDLAVHIDSFNPGAPHPNTWDHPGYLCTVSWMDRRIDGDGQPVLETEIGSIRWTDPASGREWDLQAAYLHDGKTYNPLGFVWRHFDRWHRGVPLLHPFYGDHRSPAQGLYGRLLTDGPWALATEAPALADPAAASR
ncbi:hypothetical protein OG871_39860 (plasmid) [Kitasatospora sp. NBC_00374]|uniref:hypothetical protein n=1 Tax=Kitasatospora sp. NBC_00374 TaxID=2975964 RepID=UPI002F91326D